MLDDLKDEVQFFALKLLVKFGHIKDTVLREDELNELIESQLPEVVSINSESGKGELEVKRANLTMPLGSNCFKVILFCELSVELMGSQFYKAELEATLNSKPKYHQNNKAIYLSEVVLSGIEIVDEDLLMMSEVQRNTEELLPPMFKDMFKSSVDVAVGIFDAISNTDTKKNIEQMKSEARQSVLDYHHSEMEAALISFLEDESVHYQLDDSSMETRLFSELGESVEVKDGGLIFKFRR